MLREVGVAHELVLPGKLNKYTTYTHMRKHTQTHTHHRDLALGSSRP